MARAIRYCAGYRYQLRETYAIQTPIRPGRNLVTELVRLDADGRLTIRKYFAWDGCSGPCWNDRRNARACLVHDALYYLMRTGLLSACWRPVADELLADIMIEDGAWPIRADYYRLAVDLFAGPCARPEHARRIMTAPGREIP
jgi:hypothetical protein